MLNKELFLQNNANKVITTTEINNRFTDISYSEIKLLNNEPITHILSHQRLTINFWQVKLKRNIKAPTPWFELTNFAFPIVIHNFIQHLTKENKL